MTNPNPNMNTNPYAGFTGYPPANHVETGASGGGYPYASGNSNQYNYQYNSPGVEAKAPANTYTGPGSSTTMFYPYSTSQAQQIPSTTPNTGSTAQNNLYYPTDVHANRPSPLPTTSPYLDTKINPAVGPYATQNSPDGRGQWGGYTSHYQETNPTPMAGGAVNTYTDPNRQLPPVSATDSTKYEINLNNESYMNSHVYSDPPSGVRGTKVDSGINRQHNNKRSDTNRYNSDYGYDNGYDNYQKNEDSRQANRRYAREIPKRSISLPLAPNPAKDIHITEHAEDYDTSACHPPCSVVDFVGVDTGNANPKFFRPTLGKIPCEEALLKDTLLPFGAVLSPLFQPLNEKEKVPLITGRLPIRCNRCRGYISCHSTFIDLGKKWICLLCTMVNDVDDENFCNLENNKRLDLKERPEFCFGTVEYDVGNTSDYASKSPDGAIIPPRPLHYLFVVDVSQHALNTFLPNLVTAMKIAMNALAENAPMCRVSFITFSSQVHFYNFEHPLTPQVSMCDIDNPFVPLPFSSLCWMEVGQDLEKINRFLSNLPIIASDLHEDKCALGAAVQAALLIFAGQHGGHVILTSHCFPNCGIGAAPIRDYDKTRGSDQESKLLRPMNGFWTTTATNSAKQSITFDLFMFATEFCDLVTLSSLCHVTNGKLHLFSGYDPLVDNTRLEALMEQLVSEEVGYAAILRVRCSTGLRVKGYKGHYLSQDVHDMDLSNVSSSSTFFVEFTHEGSLERNGYAHFQCALLYTTQSGERRVRVHSYRTVAVNTYQSLYEGGDLEAVFCAFVHDSLAMVVNKKIEVARKQLTDRIIKMLITYRRYCVKNNESKILLIPRQLRLIPIYSMCFLKTAAIAEGDRASIDEKVQAIYNFLSMPMRKLLLYLYPTLYPLHRIANNERYGKLSSSGKCILPQPAQLILESIATHGVYALCDEQARAVYLWIGSEVSSHTSLCLFGSENCEDIGLPNGRDESCFGERMRNIIYSLTYQDDGVRRLIIIHHGDPREESFFKLLKEEFDRLSGIGYDGYLTMIHTDINKHV